MSIIPTTDNTCYIVRVKDVDVRGYKMFQNYKDKEEKICSFLSFISAYKKMAYIVLYHETLQMKTEL